MTGPLVSASELRALVQAAPEHVTLLDVADDDHLALDDHRAVLGAGVVGGALAAPAQRLDLEVVQPVRELDQPGAADEELAAEVREDPEREDVDLQLVDDLRELVDLRAGVELGLVADQVVDPRTVRQLVDDVAPEVEVLVHLERVVLQPEPRGDHRLAGAVVGGEDPAHPASGGVVVVRLQGERALP